jgi:hypothetical protein
VVADFENAMDERSCEKRLVGWVDADERNVPEAIGDVTLADDMGGAVFGESDNFVGEGGIVAVIAKLSNRNEGFAGHSRKNIGLARSKRKWREGTIGREKGAVGGLEVDSINGAQYVDRLRRGGVARKEWWGRENGWCSRCQQLRGKKGWKLG